MPPSVHCGPTGPYPHRSLFLQVRTAGRHHDHVSRINPGSDAVPDGTLDAASALLPAFLETVRERGGDVGEPSRAPELDADGRFGWRLPTPHGDLPVLMPGAAPEVVRDHSTSAPCLRVGENWWWWRDAIGAVVDAALGKH
jgi:hypothetical protein